MTEVEQQVYEILETIEVAAQRLLNEEAMERLKRIAMERLFEIFGEE